MTLTTDAPALEALKHKQQGIWSSGDYNKIAAITVPVAETLVEAAELAPGARVLDVATGTGHVALAAARQFGKVSAVDYVPALLEVARRRAAAEALPLELAEGDAENLPYDDNVFDAVLSALGVMFTADHARAAAELVRVTRHGGTIGLANWTPEGFIGQLLATVGRHVPPPPVAKPPTRWGRPEAVRELLGDAIADVRFEKRTVTQRFASPEHFADYFLTYYGPTHMAAKSLTDEGRVALRNDIVELARGANSAHDGSFTSRWEYLVTIATKR